MTNDKARMTTEFENEGTGGGKRHPLPPGKMVGNFVDFLVEVVCERLFVRNFHEVAPGGKRWEENVDFWLDYSGD